MAARTRMLSLLLTLVVGVALGGDDAAPDPGPADKAKDAQALLERANSLRDEGRLDEALPEYEKAIKLLEGEGGDKLALASALQEYAGALHGHDAPDSADEQLARALALLREAHEGDHADVVSVLTSRAVCLVDAGRAQEALPLAHEALAMGRRLFEGDHPEVATSINNLAATLGKLGRHSEELPLHEEALAMRRRLFKGDHPDVASSLNILALTLGELGRHSAALPLVEEALAMKRRLFKGDHPDVATGINNLAYTLGALGRHSEQLALDEEALAMRRRLFKGDHPDVATSINNLASTLSALGRHSEQLPLFEEALAMLRRIFKGDHPDVASSINNLAFTLGALGRHSEELPLHEEALAMRRRLFKGDHPGVALSLNNLAATLLDLGRHSEALPLHEEVLAMRRRLFQGDHPDVATGINNLAFTLGALGRHSEALPLDEEALAMQRRLFKGDHPDVAQSIHNLASTLGVLGRHSEQLTLNDEALAMRRRLFTGDHPHVAESISNLASTLGALGRHSEQLRLYEEALPMQRRLFNGDHPDVALSLNNLAAALGALGRHSEGLPLNEEALAMWRRLLKGDHPHMALSLNNLASTLGALGRHSEALPLQDEALAMRRRLFLGDHPDVAVSLNNLAGTLGELGRHSERLPLDEEALAMLRRLFKGDHPYVATSLSNLGATLGALGRHSEDLPLQDEALAMRRRLFEGDHPAVALSINNLAQTLEALGRHAEQLPLKEEALAMWRRLFKGDHPSVATGLSNLAFTLGALGRHSEELPLQEEALAMRRRLFLGDHRDVAVSIYNLAATLHTMGRPAEALRHCAEAAEMGLRSNWPEVHCALCGLGISLLGSGDPAGAAAPLAEAVEHIETLRSMTRSFGAEEAARYSAEARRISDPFPLLVEAHLALKRADDALASLERGRARALLDLLEAGQHDPSALAAARAREAGDVQALARIDAAERAVRDAESVVVQRGGEAKRALDSGVMAAIRAARDAESSARGALAKALRDRLHVLRDVLPETKPIGCAEIQGLLAPGERMLAYSLGDRASFVFVVRPAGEPIEAFRLQATFSEIESACRACADSLARRGSDAEACKSLCEMVVPARVWEEVKTAKRLTLLPHGPLHLVPFEALWPGDAPPSAYAASASVLSWLRSRKAPARAGPSLVALGDPRFGDSGAGWPEKGLFIQDLAPDGQAVGLGVRPGDVLVKYGETQIDDLASLEEAMAGVPEGVATVEAQFVREGADRVVEVKPGRLGVILAEEAPAVAGAAMLANAVRGTAGLYGPLLPLPGTRREVEALCAAFEGRQVTTLLGEDATEARLFEAATGARFLHIATHGIIEEAQAASLSALALTRPRVPAPGDDGFLMLGDLLERWRGRLHGCELVVLSACQSQKGRLERDEGMLALPSGFLFAGARAVVASLWRVDDASTALLMADMYKRMIGGQGACDALHEARKALRRTHPDPHHWAAFVFVGAP